MESPTVCKKKRVPNRYNAAVRSLLEMLHIDLLQLSRTSSGWLVAYSNLRRSVNPQLILVVAGLSRAKHSTRNRVYGEE
jgi:hypothetical protein